MEASALAPGPEAEDDEGHCTATFVAEADELHALVQRIRDTQGAPDPGAYARVTAIVRERPPATAAQRTQSAFLLRRLLRRALLFAALRALAGSSLLCPRACCTCLAPPDSPSPCVQLTKYQEQPQLLDPHLERLVDGLTTVLRDSARQAASGDASGVDLGASQRVAKLLHVLATTRGHKACAACYSCV